MGSASPTHTMPANAFSMARGIEDVDTHSQLSLGTRVAAHVTEPVAQTPTRPPWELSSKDFLAQWRRSWDSSRASTEDPVVHSTGGAVARTESGALRITANFD